MTPSPSAAWSRYDREHAITAADREAVDATDAMRALIVELFGSDARDLYSACARLGGLFAAHDASPRLVASSIDNAARALDDACVRFERARLDPARASLLEGFVRGLQEAERAEAYARWEYPACAVPLESGAVAIACGLPSHDREALAAWADRTAAQLVRAKVRNVLVAGEPAAIEALARSTALVGIAIASEARVAESRAKRWRRYLPFGSTW